MIGIEISGGLGNQFFRYACGRTLLERRRFTGVAYKKTTHNLS